MRRCEICRGTEHVDLFDKHGYRFVRCTGCGHISVAVELDKSDLCRIYSPRFFLEGGYADYLGDERLHRRNLARYIPVLRRYGPSGRLFELGCAYGFFLDEARRHWQVTGIDVSAEATAYACQKLGLAVRHGDLLDTELEESSYDVVVLWDTIEHLAHPSAYTERLAQMLRPGGILALTTGDVNSLMARLRGRHWRLYYPPEHLHFFSRGTIRRLLEQAGLEIKEVRSVGFSRSLDTMLFRMFADRKGRFAAELYKAAKRAGVTRFSVYLNFGDIMFVVAQKPAR